MKYHRVFLKDYAQVVGPLYGLTGKNQFHWEEKHQDAFDQVQILMTTYRPCYPTLCIGSFWIPMRQALPLVLYFLKFRRDKSELMLTAVFPYPPNIDAMTGKQAPSWDEGITPAGFTVKKNLFIGNFYVFFPCRIYLKTLVLPLTH